MGSENAHKRMMMVAKKAAYETSSNADVVASEPLVLSKSRARETQPNPRDIFTCNAHERAVARLVDSINAATLTPRD